MIPVLVKDILPNARLQQYVPKYQVFRVVVDKKISPPIKHHYPKPENRITFYIRDTRNKYQSKIPFNEQDILRQNGFMN